MVISPATGAHDTAPSDLATLLASWRRHLTAQPMSPATLARRILRKNTRAVLRAAMTGRQGLRRAHDAVVARTGICTCGTGEPNPVRPGWKLDLCRSMRDVNASIAEVLAALEELGPPEPGEDKSRWRLR